MSTDRIPPGQTVTRKFPVTGEASCGRDLTPENYRLHLKLPDHQYTLKLDQILQLPQETHTVDIHCVTSWSKLDTTFSGIRLKTLFEALDITIPQHYPFIRFAAYSMRNHDTSLPTTFALENSWLVWAIDGNPLTPQHGYPLRLFTPSRYFYKSLKWIQSIEFLHLDQKGFWERTSAYHNSGIPQLEERFDAITLNSSNEILAFKNRTSFMDLQNVSQPIVFLKLPLSNWQPQCLNLQKLHIKASRFDHAQLQNADFSHANLTLSSFRGANLQGAQFHGTDLEGADFTGADLTNAQFSNNPMSATKFCSEKNSQRQGLTGYRNLMIQSPQGLLESQEEYLESIGIPILQ